MAAKTELAQLPKSAQKVARTYAGQAARSVRKKLAEEQIINAAVGYGATIAAAVVDDKFRKGIESEAKFGDPPTDGSSKFRPPVNAVIGAALTAVGLLGPKKYSATALAVGIGFGSPALYAFTRNQLAK